MRTRERPSPAAHVRPAVLYAVLLALSAIALRTGYPWVGPALGAAASALVLVRPTVATRRRSDDRAVTDGHTDRLTGLADQVGFRAAAERSLARGGRHSAVLLIDINGFREVNDALGHRAGDRVLVAFAESLRDCVPEPGLAARLHGDRFAVVLTDLTSPAQAYEIAGRIAGAVAPIVVGGRLIDLAAGIGVAVSAPGRLTHDEIVHRAESAMDRAKRNGPRTRWAAWQESAAADTHRLAA